MSAPGLAFPCGDCRHLGPGPTPCPSSSRTLSPSPEWERGRGEGRALQGEALTPSLTPPMRGLEMAGPHPVSLTRATLSHPGEGDCACALASVLTLFLTGGAS